MTLIGSQTPTYEWVSPYEYSSGQDAIDLIRAARQTLDPWQQHVITGALAEKPDGTWANNEVGLIVSRQCGKGGVIEAREIAGVFAFNERSILHSAHQQKTSNDMFLRMIELLQSNPEFDRSIQQIHRSKGEEGFIFRIRHEDKSLRCARCRHRDEDWHSARLRYMARTGSAGRGFTKSDLIVIDEAMILDDAPVAALVPTMATQPNWQIWYCASQGDRRLPTESRVLARIRRRGYRREPGLYFAEWSAHLRHNKDCPRDERGEPTDRLDVRGDPATWAKAVPAMGIRISEEFLRLMIVGGGMAEWDADREFLGVGDYPAEDGWDVVAEQAWKAAEDPHSKRGPVFAVGISVAFDQRTTSVSVASRRDDGMWHMETVKTEDGWAWVPAYAAAMRKHGASVVVVDRRAPCADDVVKAVGARHVYHPSATEYPAWCAKLVQLLTETGEARHIGQDRLTAAVKHVEKVTHPGGVYTWKRTDVKIDVTPWDAVTLAVGGLLARGGRPRRGALVAAV